MGEAGVPTATMLRPTPGSVADLTAQLAVMRREVLATHDALNAAGAPMGGSPAYRVTEWAAKIARADAVRAAEPTTPTEIAGALHGADARIAMLERDILDYEERIAIIGRGVVAANVALDTAGAPKGSTVAERIAALTDDRDIERRDGNEYLAALVDLRRGVYTALGLSDKAGNAELVTLVERMSDEVRARVGEMEARKPSPSLPHVLALLDLAAEKNAALTHLVAILRGAL